MTQCHISSKLLIENCPNEIITWAHQNLEYDNPEFYKAQRMNKWTGNIPEQIVLWERIGSGLVLPYGVCRELFQRFGGMLQAIPHMSIGERIDYQSHIQLYDYQEWAVQQAQQNPNGVIVMPCGAGKTQTALELISRIGLRTLWITHTHELLNQSKKRAEDCFGINPDTMGTITSGKIDVGTSITFGTVQTLVSVDLKDYKDYWDVIVVDECHKAVGTPTKLMMFYKVVSQLNALYKIGITATPKRSDGLERSMFALLGEPICEIPQSAVNSHTVPVMVQRIDTEYYPNIQNPKIFNMDGTLNYVGLTNEICADSERNALICDVLSRLDSPCLVLSDRVEHLKQLQSMLGEGVVISSQDVKKADRENRKQSMGMLNSGQIRYLFATYQLAKEGLDIPTLKYVAFTTPKKDSITVIQASGRVSRQAPGKTQGCVLDFVDSRFSMLDNYWKCRQRIYRSKKYKIVQ